MYFYGTALNFAIQKENIEIIKLLLSNENINPNLPNILLICILIEFKSYFINSINKS